MARDMGSLLIVDEDLTLIDSLERFFTAGGYTVRTCLTGAEATRLAARWRPAVVLLDMTLSDCRGPDLLERLRAGDRQLEVIMLTPAHTVPLTVEALGRGAYSVVEKPVDLDPLERLVAEACGPRRTDETPPATRGATPADDGIIGQSPGLLAALRVVRSVASSDANVLIHGESGTGKELIARAVHRQSRRHDRPFVTINCAAVPGDLMEAELFGYRKGAFTGATADRDGVVAQAESGSLLLDEVGEMPPLLQTKLLRLLQEREYRPLGADRDRPADFRLICTTNIDLRQALTTQRLREDLYFRISTVSVRIPPLRERGEDIVRLAEHFLTLFRTRHHRSIGGFAPGALERVRRYDWPGNVRELQGAIEHAVLLARTDRIELGDLPERVRACESVRAPFRAPGNVTLAELEKQAILQTLERTGWNKCATANRLGLYRATLYSKMRKHAILPPARSA